MFRAIAKRLVGAKPETMEWTEYRHTVRRVEMTLRNAVSKVATVITGIVLMIALIGMMLYALVAEEPGYYKPNPDGVLVDGMPYHYHLTEGCDIDD